MSIATIASSSTTRTRTLIAGSRLEKKERSYRHSFQNVLQNIMMHRNLPNQLDLEQAERRAFADSARSKKAVEADGRTPVSGPMKRPEAALRWRREK
jgi:hypothetical protein